MAEVPQGTNWHVVDVDQTTRVTRAGRFEDVYEFTVETVWGGVFKLQLPILGYDPSTLKVLAQDEYETLTAGRFLTG